jgi:hypothetical protein
VRREKNAFAAAFTLGDHRFYKKFDGFYHSKCCPTPQKCPGTKQLRLCQDSPQQAVKRPAAFLLLIYAAAKEVRRIRVRAV